MNKNAGNVQDFSSRLKVSRQQAGLTQSEFAKKLGLKGNTPIYRFELGTSSPSIDVLCRIAEVLKVDLHWLITGLPSPAEKRFREAQIEVIGRLAKYIGTAIGELMLDFKRISDELNDLTAKKHKGEKVKEGDMKSLEEEKFRIIRALADLQKDQPWVTEAIEKLSK
ncbi:MAG: helix-turn-helix transcriptional regulator [Sedimentisphaerales bacterium]|jgi:transcriptional regulator with XRE-family HTH domain